MKSTKRKKESHVFEHHQMIDEEDTFALKQLPDGLSPLPFGLRERLYVVLLGRRKQVRPVRVLKQ